MFGFSRFLWNRKSLSVGRGVFVVLDKLERNLLEIGFVGDQKVELKVFWMEIPGKLSNRLTCVWNFLMLLWSYWLRGFLRQFALIFWAWNEEKEWSSDLLFILCCLRLSIYQVRLFWGKLQFEVLTAVCLKTTLPERDLISFTIFLLFCTKFYFH